MDIKFLVKLTSKAWALPILAQMDAGVPGRQAALQTATGASRTAFGQSLAHLQQMKLVEKTSGHGHPLRPEYRLTPQGAALTKPAFSILELTDGTPQAFLIRRMWVLPLLATTQVPQTFTALATALYPITDRALSQALQRLQTEGWMDRDVDIAARPPRATYQAKNTGCVIGAQARELLNGGSAPLTVPTHTKGQLTRSADPTLG